MTPLPGMSALKAVLGNATFGKGMDYVRRGLVRGVWWDSEEPGVLQAEVKGGEHEPYEQDIAWREEKGFLTIDGECTCPMGFNCKHVAAALIQANVRPPLDAPPPLPELPAVPTPQPRRLEIPGRPGAPDPVDLWLKSLSQAQQPAGQSTPTPDVPDTLLYVLAPDSAHRGVLVNVVRARRLKSGEYGVPQPVRDPSLSQARYVSDWDRRMLRLIRTQQQPVYPDTPRLEQDWGAELLPRLIASARCHWLDIHAPPLTMGAARSGRLRWEMDAEARSRPLLEVNDANAVLPLSPPYYVDARRHEIGGVDCGMPPALAMQLLLSPPLSPDRTPRVIAAWSQALGPWSEALAPPPRVEIERRSKVLPVPVFELKRLTVDRGWGTPLIVDVGELAFDYDGLRCTSENTARDLSRVVDGRVVQIPRMPELERKADGRIGGAGLSILHGVYGRRIPYRVPPAHIGAQGWIDFLALQAPKLKEQGWRIEIAPDFPWAVYEPEEQWDAQIEEGRDWFDLALRIVVDGKPTQLLPLLVSLLHGNTGQLDRASLKEMKDDTAVVVRDEHGRLVSLKAGRIKPILGTLLELYDERPLDAKGRLRLPRNAGLLLESLGQNLRYAGGEQVRELAAKLRTVAGLEPVAAPSGLRCELRDYQSQGLAWLQFLRRMDLAGVLADDMGLGKTVQTLAHLLLEKEQGRLDRPALVIAPTSLMFNWRRESERFAPALKVLVLHGTDRKDKFEAIAQHDLVLSTYPLLPRDIAILKKQPWHIVVLDEAQNIKNAKSKAAQLVAGLDTRHRLALTGTPLENHLGELWSLFNFLMPGYLADERAFRRRFRTPIEKHADAEMRAQLARRIAPFLLRRTKSQVASELPPRTEIVRSVALDGAQRDLYETVREAMQEKLRREIEQRGLARSQIVLLDALLKLRQICCDPRLLKLEAARGVRESAKLELLMTLLPEMLDEGRRVLLFSQFTSMLALIEEELATRGITYLKLTGETRDRQSLVDSFQRCEVPLFLISLKAGGVGLNLTAADTVIHYDPWWNPAVEQQATDRAHRIGQDKPVFVYKLYTESTVEEKIAALQAQKRELADALFGEGTSGALKLDGETLARLFDPLS